MTGRMSAVSLLAALALAWPPQSVSGQDVAAAPVANRLETAVAPVPFGPGEKAVYRVSWGIFRSAGTAITEISGVQNVRGNPSYHLSFSVKGGIPGARVNDVQESWLDVARLFSHRFKQDLDQPRYERLRTLDFYPADMMWRRQEKPDSGALASRTPLDDVSFLYWSRTLPLEVGRTYEFQRYYKEEGNPVIVKVLRKQRVKVPAGEFDTLVLKPLIRTSGLFADGGEAEIYLSDDEHRIIVMVKTKLSIATMQMQLQEYTAGRKL